MTTTLLLPPELNQFGNDEFVTVGVSSEEKLEANQFNLEQQDLFDTTSFRGGLERVQNLESERFPTRALELKREPENEMKFGSILSENRSWLEEHSVRKIKLFQSYFEPEVDQIVGALAAFHHNVGELLDSYKITQARLRETLEDGITLSRRLEVKFALKNRGNGSRTARDEVPYPFVLTPEVFNHMKRQTVGTIEKDRYFTYGQIGKFKTGPSLQDGERVLFTSPYNAEFSHDVPIALYKGREEISLREMDLMVSEIELPEDGARLKKQIRSGKHTFEFLARAVDFSADNDTPSLTNEAGKKGKNRDSVDALRKLRDPIRWPTIARSPLSDIPKIFRAAKRIRNECHLQNK